MEQLIILGIFSGIKTWTISAVVGAVLGLGIVKKWALIVDRAAKFVAKWSGKIYVEIQEHSNIFLDVQNTSQKIDDAISDDGTTNLNTLKEALELGKKVKIDLEDIVIDIKPKK